MKKLKVIRYDNTILCNENIRPDEERELRPRGRVKVRRTSHLIHLLFISLIGVFNFACNSTAEDASAPVAAQGADATNTPEPTTIPNADQILFNSDRDGDQEIYVVNVDGSDLRQLTDNSFFESNPAWSADGQQMAFVSDQDGDWEIYVMNVDGSEVAQLTHNEGQDWSPSWSPIP